MRNILLFGPLPLPYTGQSISFQTVVNSFEKDHQLIVSVINIANKNTILSGFFLLIKITINLLFNKYDVVYFTCSRSKSGAVRDLVLLSLCRMKNIRVINHLHGNDFRSFYLSSKGFYKKLLTWCYRGVSKTIILFEDMVKEFEDFPDMKLSVVSNNYSKELDELPQEKETNKSIKLLYLSNIMKTKGILLLLKAFYDIGNNYPDIELNIAGKFLDDYESDVTAIKREFELLLHDLSIKFPNRIRYHGPVHGEKKSELLWESDIFILPTYHRTEAFPISLLEAMRAGNFIITTRHNFIDKIFNNDNGTLIEPKETNPITKAVEEILENPNKLNQIQNSNIKTAISKYSENSFLEALKKELL